MTDFEQWLQTTPEYKNLLIQHGERLFIVRDGEYEILTVRLVHRAWVLCGGINATVKDDGVLNPDGSLMNTGQVVDHDSYVPIKSM